MMGKSSHNLPQAAEIEAARQALRALCRLERDGDTLLRVEVPGGKKPVTALVPQSAFDAFLKILQQMSSGEDVMVFRQDAELTSQQAANILNVSRPYLNKLLEEGEIPFRKVGRHRRIQAMDVLEYKQQAYKKSGEALDELARLSEELGLY